MCGRYSLGVTADVLPSAFQLTEVPDWEPRYNIAPTQPVLAVLGLPDAPRVTRRLRWGLIPSWAKEISIGSKLINARAETVAEKPSFRSAFRQRRCLILADGFYEWKRVEGKKQPHYFQRSDKQPFAFAGLWERWHNGENTIDSCTILTTQANALLEPIHDRMPVMLPPEIYDRWLDSTTPPNQLQALLQPFPPEAMQGFAVSSLVNSPKHDRPECINSL